MERLNAQALAALIDRHGVKLSAFSADLIAAARKTSDDVLGDLAARDAATAKVHGSYKAFRDRVAAWSRVSIEAVLRARVG
jgi:TRAP-type mannitol/chloroaromatic compound transport system substrate-binding protein